MMIAREGFYVADVRIRSDNKLYKPGELVEELPEEEIKYLFLNGFVKWMRRTNTPEEEVQDKDMLDGEDFISEDKLPENEIPEDELPEDDVPELYTEEQLNKLPSKAAIVEYAESIGLSGLNANLHKPELIDKVLEYIDGVME